MENQGFLDQFMYETALGSVRPAAMPGARRPHHLATFQHPHPHNAVITHAHSNTIPHSHLGTAGHRGIPATAHLHGGRVVGVTGVPTTTSAGSTPAGTPQGAPQPLYSCQAPRGHSHVYQCPGHRGDPEGLEGPPQHYLEQGGGAGPEHRTEYHYGGSDYSSTEPIYAQPHIHPPEGQSPARTPPLAYAPVRASLRGSSHLHGTPARFLVRTDSTGASTSSSTLPTVSALMAMDPARPRPRAHSHEFAKAAVLSGAPNTPAKLKGGGVLGAWRAKYLEGAGGGRKAALLLGLLVLLLVLVLGGLAAVLYLTRE